MTSCYLLSKKDKISLMTLLKTQAIQTALTGDWQAAIHLNEKLLEENPDDIETLNRLAFAHVSCGNTKEARGLYQKVLTLDTQNPIAMRNLKRLGSSTKSSQNGNPVLMNNIFIEESGKTKVIELINVAEQKIISQLHSGQHIELSVKRMKIFALDSEKQYIGMLPDDISKRLIKFVNGGNKYEAYIKTVNSHQVIIFMKEIKRAARFRNQPSFIQNDRSKFQLTNNVPSKNHGGVKQAKDALGDDDDYSSDNEDNEESF